MSAPRCHRCGEPLHQPGGQGRPRKWCSTDCQNAEWRDHNREHVRAYNRAYQRRRRAAA
jgi:hypothetical protein